MPHLLPASLVPAATALGATARDSSTLAAKNPLACWVHVPPGRSPTLVDRIGDRIATFNDAHPRTKQFQAVMPFASDMLTLLRQVPRDLHPADDRGPCLCSHCEFRSAVAKLLAQIP